MKSNLVKILLLFCILGILSSCNSQKVSVVESNPCSPPCWYGIIPGETSVNEAIGLLLLIPGIHDDREKIEDYLSNNKIISLRKVREEGLQIYCPDEKVTNISLYSENWNLREIIDLYGEPLYYLSFYQQYESTYRSVILLYPKNGIYVSIKVRYFNETTKNSVISYDSEVDSIRFTQIEGLLDNLGLTIMGYQNEFFKNNNEPWQGVGELITTGYTF